jgi:hypothetical protein
VYVDPTAMQDEVVGQETPVKFEDPTGAGTGTAWMLQLGAAATPCAAPSIAVVTTDPATNNRTEREIMPTPLRGSPRRGPPGARHDPHNGRAFAELSRR